jgi:hypothetical protein
MEKMVVVELASLCRPLIPALNALAAFVEISDPKRSSERE